MERVATAAIPKSASTVLVACKIPAGLILELCEMQEVMEGSPTGSRPVKKAVKVGERIKLNGSALKFGQVPEDPMPGGFALTSVPADFWQEWVRQNHDSDALKNGLIFAHASQSEVSQQAKENRKIKSGFEQIDPKNPPRVGGLKVTPYDGK